MTVLLALLALALILVASRATPASSGAPPDGSATPRPTATVSPRAPARPTQSPPPSATPTIAPSPSVTPRPTSAPTPPPTPRPTPPGPPACAHADVLTGHHGYADWPISLLDTIHHLPADYAPTDLVDSSAAGVDGGYLVRSIVVADLRALAEAARSNGTPIQLVSAYRSHAQQHATFQHWVDVGGYEQALRTSARAGHSEHQLGTTIDVTGEGDAAPWEYVDWAMTPAGSWMGANAWRYGFVMSYPRGAFADTCYDYEPWHYRYVGRDLAARIQAEGRAPRLVLWELQ